MKSTIDSEDTRDDWGKQFADNVAAIDRPRVF